ncbi:DNA (cytosine-5)-methyltransferase CMT2 [Cardamine amara subsp. amara]|uniref:DNA (cytosine-5-)-methyltransferase n=1 Tax=Cardamine amara subsp. amara TaxID=228776 RepID=A0ABD1C5M4_CARAN
MLSPEKCDSEEATTQLNPQISSRSEPQCLSLVLWLPNPEDPEEATTKSPSKELTKLSDGGEMSSSRRSPRLNKENGGEDGGSQRKSSRRSPRFRPVDEKIDNVCSVPVTGKFGSRKRKCCSDLVKEESLDSEGLTFKEIAVIAKSLEMEIISECQYKETNVEVRSRLQGPAKRKVDSDTLSSTIDSSNQSLGSNKRMRRSPRFIKGTENEGEEKENPLAFKTSPRLSGIVENGHTETLNTIKDRDPGLRGAKQVRGTEKRVHISENDNYCEVIKKCEGGGGLVSSKKKLSNSPSGCIKPTVNDSRGKMLGKPRSADLNAADIHTSSLGTSENCMCNGLTATTALGEKGVMESSLQGKTSVCGAADKGIAKEMHVNSTVIHLSDSDEQSSVEYLYMKNSNGDILTQVESESTKPTKGKGKRVTRTAVHEKDRRSNCFFIGEPIFCEEAQERWRWRYDLKERKSKSRGQQLEDDEDKIVANVECHYLQANVDGHTFSLGDFACIKGEEEENHVGKIVEFFKTTDGESHFRVQWFYRATDTVMEQQATDHEKRRLFYSTVMNDNPIDCIISKVTVIQVSPRAGLKPNSIKSDYYFDMEYCVEYSTFRTLRNPKSSKNQLECCADVIPTESTEALLKNNNFSEELPVLDLYSGCGGMSTGLSLGAKISGVDIATKWAVDQNLAACESLKLNHPKTQVRNDAAGDFLLLLKEWDKLCKRYVFHNDQRTDTFRSENSTRETGESSSSKHKDSDSGEYEVEKLVDICYGDPNDTGKNGLKFKVHWKGYSSNEDTWEPAKELSNCQDAIRDFVTSGIKSKILPLPGGVGVICGGPPCQGISGYNRYRNVDSPLSDERNQQIIVFMDIVEYLKPAFVLMENVVDILRLDKGSLGRYALSRLVHMRYQARLGIMTAGCYGLSQFRSRVFMWGADPNKNLPPFPLPTHDVIVRYGFPLEFERNVVAYVEGQPRQLEKALVLKDAISDLPHVTNDEDREKMPYESLPETDFQKYIRSTKHDLTGSAIDNCNKRMMLLHDHRPFYMFEDDYVRVCQIPKRKGANFRDLPGLIVRNDNTVCRDPSMKPVILPSGKPLVPEYVFTFQQGKSKRPFARVWWDETVPTVLTVPSCHNQALLHPEQDRILTIRECARLQGFPDYFQFCGTIKERYCQIGNAVAVSVSRALGYSLGMAFCGVSHEEHVIKLPQNFSHSSYLELQETIPH